MVKSQEEISRTSQKRRKMTNKSIVLETQHLQKNFGSLQAVKSLDLVIPKGEVFGLLGPNGSGKSTTLAMILGALPPTKGDFRWFPDEPKGSLKQRVGAILEGPAFYPYLSANENLEIVCKIKEISPGRIPEVLEQVNLADRANDDFKTYSLGMKQRLAIASALLSNPEVLILDEPTNGLDPQGIIEIRELILEIAREGKTIILASHLLDEVQKVCSHFAVLRKGENLYQGAVEEINQEQATLTLQSEDLVQLETTLKEFSNLTDLKKDPRHVKCKLQGDTKVTDLHRYLIEKGIVLTHLSQESRSLEKRFLEILGNN